MSDRAASGSSHLSSFCRSENVWVESAGTLGDVHVSQLPHPVREQLPVRVDHHGQRSKQGKTLWCSSASGLLAPGPGLMKAIATACHVRPRQQPDPKTSLHVFSGLGRPITQAAATALLPATKFLSLNFVAALEHKG